MRIPANHGRTAWTSNLPFASMYTAGLAGQAFFEALRDQGQILGSRCDKCQWVYVPAALFCERCFAELTDRIPVANEGEVVSLTLCHIDLEGQPLDPPDVVALVRLDGAQSVLVHRGLGDPSRWKIGARAKVRLRDDRKGSILDIEGFELV